MYVRFQRVQALEGVQPDGRDRSLKSAEGERPTMLDELGAARKTQGGEPTQHREAQIVSLRSARVIVERDQAERGLLRGGHTLHT